MDREDYEVYQQFSKLFLDSIAGARYIHPVEEHNMILVWHGGFTINGVNPHGRTVCMWGLDGAVNPTLEQVMDNITEHIDNDEFPC